MNCAARIGGDTSPDAAAEDRDSPVHVPGGNGPHKRGHEIGVVVIQIQAISAMVDNLMARSLEV